MSRAELLDAADITEAQLAELEGYGLVAKKGSHYDGDALLVARTIAEMAAFGLEARHLRAFKQRRTARSGWSSKS